MKSCSDENRNDNLRYTFTKMRLLTSSSGLFDAFEYENKDTSTQFLSSEFGLMITVDDGNLRLRLCPDSNFPEIHPNVYAPEELSEVKALSGGGSGVTVFSGKHAELGDLVMKHGGFKDLHELYALATIEHELNMRGSKNNSLQGALDMHQRIPVFKMIYISPSHIMERNWWGALQHVKSFQKSYSTKKLSDDLRTPIRIDHSLVKGFCGDISFRFFESNENNFAIQLDTISGKKNFSVILPKGLFQRLDERTVIIRDSYNTLKATVDDLLPIMTDRLLKFTLAQKAIGDKKSKAGNQWLYEGKLHGPILDNLILQYIQVIQQLQNLTLPAEVDVVNSIRDELQRLENDDSVQISSISDTADTFVGNAIKKNFHEKRGRVRFLNEIGQKFREMSLVLSPDEVLPAKFIGALLQTGAVMSDIFWDSSEGPISLKLEDICWKTILRRAVDSRASMSASALKRLWNCGLADAGIHNLFLSVDNMFFFDLAEPKLQSLPGFLTKFLFSFFHTLGMEEDAKTGWVRRFLVDGEKLRLTEETMTILPMAYTAFETCLNRLISEVLDGDKKIRWLLLQYVTLQLLSDAAFCLQRWTVKGGGQDRKHNHQKGIEKWLWRTLWDLWVVFDINTPESLARFGGDDEFSHLLMRTQIEKI